MAKDTATGTVAKNRRARFDYAIEDTLECGLVLTGTEVKAMRAGKLNISDAYVGPKDGELFLMNAHVGEYKNAGRFQHEPKRARKILVHRRERDRLIGAAKREGMTLVPLSIYFNKRGIAKLSLGLAKGKKTVDKRRDIADRDWKRRQSRLIRERG